MSSPTWTRLYLFLLIMCLVGGYVSVSNVVWGQSPAADPMSFTTIASLGGAGNAVAANQEYAFVGDGQGIVVFRLDGVAPVGAARYAMPGLVRDLSLKDDLLAVAADNQVVINRLSGKDMSRVAMYQAASAINRLTLEAGRLYLGTTTGLEIVDLINPQAPAQLSFLPRDYGVSRIIVEGTTLYALSSRNGIDGLQDGGVIKVDIADTAQPQLLASVSLNGGGTTITGGRGLVLKDGRVFVAGDISGPRDVGTFTFSIWSFSAESLEDVQQQSFTSNDRNDAAVDMVVYQEYLLVLRNLGGISVIDPSNPAELTQVAERDLADDSSDLAVVGTRAFTSLSNGGMQALDLANPLAPTATPIIPLLGPVFDMVMVGETLVTEGIRSTNAAPERVFSVFDLRNPAAPVLMTQQVIAPDERVFLTAEGVHLLYNTISDDARLFDTRIPGEFAQSNSLELGVPSALAVRGNLAYLGIQNIGGDTYQTEILDLSVFNNVTSIAALPAATAIRDLAIKDATLYRLSIDGRLELLSLTNPLEPALIGEVMLSETHDRLTVVDDTIYVSSSEGVQIVDARNPAEPLLGNRILEAMGQPALAVHAGRLAVSGCVTVELEANCSLQLFDLSDPLAPVLIAGHDQSIPFAAVAGTGPRVVYAAGAYGVGVSALLSERAWLPLVVR